MFKFFKKKEIIPETIERKEQEMKNNIENKEQIITEETNNFYNNNEINDEPEIEHNEPEIKHKEEKLVIGEEVLGDIFEGKEIQIDTTTDNICLEIYKIRKNQEGETTFSKIKWFDQSFFSPPLNKEEVDVLSTGKYIVKVLNKNNYKYYGSKVFIVGNPETKETKTSEENTTTQEQTSVEQRLERLEKIIVSIAETQSKAQSPEQRLLELAIKNFEKSLTSNKDNFDFTKVIEKISEVMATTSGIMMKKLVDIQEQQAKMQLEQQRHRNEIELEKLKSELGLTARAIETIPTEKKDKISGFISGVKGFVDSVVPLIKEFQNLASIQKELTSLPQHNIQEQQEEEVLDALDNIGTISEQK